MLPSSHHQHVSFSIFHDPHVYILETPAVQACTSHGHAQTAVTQDHTSWARVLYVHTPGTHELVDLHAPHMLTSRLHAPRIRQCVSDQHSSPYLPTPSPGPLTLKNSASVLPRTETKDEACDTAFDHIRL